MILTFMWKFKRKIAVSLILPLVMALSMATIYGQYHYFTDVLAGLIMGLVIGFIAIRTTENFLNRKQALEDVNPFG
jgi:membrane-associated phospholipid phosphatase